MHRHIKARRAAKRSTLTPFSEHIPQLNLARKLLNMSKPIAIIAGAGPGTGSAVARRFALAYPVVLLARSQQSLDPLVTEITKNGGSAIGVPTDVTSASSMGLTMDKIKNKFGPEITVAAAIYNVASKFSMKPFLGQTPEEFNDMLEPSIKGAFNFAQATLPYMLKGDPGLHPPTLIFTGTVDVDFVREA